MFLILSLFLSVHGLPNIRICQNALNSFPSEYGLEAGDIDLIYENAPQKIVRIQEVQKFLTFTLDPTIRNIFIYEATIANLTTPQGFNTFIVDFIELMQKDDNFRLRRLIKTYKATLIGKVFGDLQKTKGLFKRGQLQDALRKDLRNPNFVLQKGPLVTMSPRSSLNEKVFEGLLEDLPDTIFNILTENNKPALEFVNLRIWIAEMVSDLDASVNSICERSTDAEGFAKMILATRYFPFVDYPVVMRSIQNKLQAEFIGLKKSIRALQKANEPVPVFSLPAEASTKVPPTPNVHIENFKGNRNLRHEQYQIEQAAREQADRAAAKIIRKENKLREPIVNLFRGPDPRSIRSK